MTYHLERDSTALYIWRDGGPCVAIMPFPRPYLLSTGAEDRAEVERLAAMLLAAANRPQLGEEGT